MAGAKSWLALLDPVNGNLRQFSRGRASQLQELLVDRADNSNYW